MESWSPFAHDAGVLNNELLKGIADKYNKSVAQVILRWLVQRDVVVIPKSKSKERIIENISIFDFELTAEDMAAITTLGTGKSSIFDHHYPASIKGICEAKFNI
ncbi:aldo/keto reductase [Dysgonomonas sp. ZJ279]|uniref:aldo/keto reductase n=1 Tax=Dysgonomonas sp. ZJ279 TaxID=2709796 RepID=UPI0013EAC93E|nr:aldo/keto reductase [Dysgonomonas sp. ZJ279]